MIKPGVIEKASQHEAGDIINAIEELGIEVASFNGRPRIFNNEVKCFCPFHDDHPKPSFSINLQTGLWHCWSNCGGGNWEQLLRRLHRTDISARPVVPEGLRKVYEYEKLFKEKTEELHSRLTVFIDRTNRSDKYHEKAKAEYFIGETEDRIVELCKIREGDSMEQALATLNSFIKDTLDEIERRTRLV